MEPVIENCVGRIFAETFPFRSYPQIIVNYRMLADEILERIRKITMIVSDVDGVLTDGSIHIHSDGTESKQFTVEDAAGASFARLGGFELALLSARHSESTAIRAREMKIAHCIQGRLDKLGALRELCRTTDREMRHVAYIGDGLVDLPVLERSGLAVSPANGHPLVKEAVHYITRRSGGKGVLRETVELILEHQGRFDSVMKKMRREVYRG